MHNGEALCLNDDDDTTRTTTVTKTMNGEDSDREPEKNCILHNSKGIIHAIVSCYLHVVLNVFVVVVVVIVVV